MTSNGGLAGLTDDYQSDGQRAAQLAEKLITDDKVDVLFSPFGSGHTKIVATIAARYDMPTIACAASSESVFDQNSGYLFGTLSPNAGMFGSMITGMPRVRNGRYCISTMPSTRRAVKAWGLDIIAVNPAEYSGVLTAVIMPDGRDADAFRQIVLERFDMSLGTGLGRLKGKVFRIGHLGDLNDLTVAGTLSGVEMGLRLADVPHKAGGVMAALESLAAESLAPIS